GSAVAIIVNYPAYAPSSVSVLTSTSTTVTVTVSHHCLGCTPLSVQGTYAYSSKGTAGTIVQFEVVAGGGSTPYNYTAT
ncbi:MAG: hypothetical protein JRN08_10120, partial [Nitrososphaerota archaeon]|nr:hypothetical protein [Nitrososphaerota archaeon]